MKLQKFSSFILIIAMLVFSFGLFPKSTDAAALTSMSDTMSRLKAGNISNHTIVFTTPTGITASDAIFTITFPAGFDTSTIVEDDVDVDGSVVGELTTADDCTGSEMAGVVMAADVLSITICSGDGGAISAAETVTVEIGNNATSSGTGSHKIVNDVAGEATIAIATPVDSGSLAIDLIADDRVVITATVDPTITFTIDDTAIGFGTLSSTTGRWAGAVTGTDASEALPDVAHTMTIATNATSGYSITYEGALLTSGSDTISAATISGDSDGTPGSEQFGISISTNGSGSITSGYSRDATADFKFTAGTATEIISYTDPTATETISVSYLTNISGTTEAGSYSTVLTYIATATF